MDGLTACRCVCLFCRCTLYLPSLHPLPTVAAPSTHRRCTLYPPSLHPLSTVGAPSIHRRCTLYSPSLHPRSMHPLSESRTQSRGYAMHYPNPQHASSLRLGLAKFKTQDSPRFHTTLAPRGQLPLPCSQLTSSLFMQPPTLCGLPTDSTMLPAGGSFMQPAAHQTAFMQARAGPPAA